MATLPGTLDTKIAPFVEFLRQRLGRQPSYPELADLFIQCGLNLYAEGKHELGIGPNPNSNDLVPVVVQRVNRLIGGWD